MAATQPNGDLQDRLAQRDFGANFKDGRTALANTQAGFFKPRKVILAGWLDQAKTGCIEMQFLGPQQIDFQPDALTQGRLPAQFTEAYRRRRPGQEQQQQRK